MTVLFNFMFFNENLHGQSASINFAGSYYKYKVSPWFEYNGDAVDAASPLFLCRKLFVLFSD